MSLYVKHSAWLNATPSRAPEDKSTSPSLSRIERMRRANKDEDPEMPPVGAGGYLLGYLFEIGPTLDSGPLTQAELRAWQLNVGIVLEPWEIRVLRRLSCDYVASSHAAIDRNAPAPWGAAINLSVVAISMKNSIRTLANL